MCTCKDCDATNCLCNCHREHKKSIINGKPVWERIIHEQATIQQEDKEEDRYREEPCVEDKR